MSAQGVGEWRRGRRSVEKRTPTEEKGTGGGETSIL